MGDRLKKAYEDTMLGREFRDIEDVYIHYLPGSPKLEQSYLGGCVDLYTYEDIVLKKGQSCMCSLGFSMQLPQCYDALIFPRSSTFNRTGLLLTNSVGYVDNAFRGQDDVWRVCVYATEDISIAKGARLFQMRIIEVQPKLNFIERQHLDSENRGGFGEGTGE